MKKGPSLLNPKGRGVPALLDRLYGYTDYARRRNAPYTPAVYDPGGMTRLLAALGNPQTAFQIVHLAGTKGKGSTATYLARLLTAAGHRTGLTTSPQVFDERDRIAVGGQIISWAAFGRLFEVCEKAARKAGLKPTVFEFFTAMALLYFKEKKVAWAVVETGLGGRLDSTNVLNPRLTAITAIGYDHMDKLGNTLTLIAGEKAGIIKHQVPVVMAPQRATAEKVIRKKARQMSAPVERVAIEKMPPGLHGLVPAYQLVNRATALKCLEVLGMPLPPPSKWLGALSSPIPGRYQKIGPFLVDGAHNPLAMEKLAGSIQKDPGLKGKMALVVFCLADKDLKGMLKPFPQKMPRFYYDLDLPWAPANRAANLKRLPRGMPVLKNVGELKALCHRFDHVVVTGSFSLVSHVLRQNLGGDGPRVGKGMRRPT